jgi:hypothetical protein
MASLSAFIPFPSLSLSRSYETPHFHRITEWVLRRPWLPLSLSRLGKFALVISKCTTWLELSITVGYTYSSLSPLGLSARAIRPTVTLSPIITSIGRQASILITTIYSTTTIATTETSQLSAAFISLATVTYKGFVGYHLKHIHASYCFPQFYPGNVIQKMWMYMPNVAGWDQQGKNRRNKKVFF